MDDATPVNLPPLPKRLLQVFFSPGELFEDLRENPVWFWTLLVVGLLVGLSLVLIPVDLWIEFSRSQMIEQGRPVPPGFEDLGKVMQIASVGGGIIMTFVMTFLISAVAKSPHSSNRMTDLMRQQMLSEEPFGSWTG